MLFFSGSNFSEAYYKMLSYAKLFNGNMVESRLGLVKNLGAACFEISGSELCLPFLKNRNINPFFALTEFAWMIRGLNTVKPLKYFISHYDDFSDDKVTLNGAYGYRLCRAFGINQIEAAIEMLKNSKNTRRVVLNMWSVTDLNKDSNDIPCNTSIYLKIHNGCLDITVLNRSNDLYLGVPYDAFLFYCLQKYICIEIGCKMGMHRHYTDSLHLYKNDFFAVDRILESNDVVAFDKLINLLPKFNINKFISDKKTHLAITELDFSSIQDKDLYNLFSRYRNKADDIVKFIPQNDLGFLIYMWCNRKEKKTNGIDYFDNLISEAEDFNVWKLSFVKYKDDDSIKKEISVFCNMFKSKCEILQKVVRKRKNLFTLREQNDTTKDKFLIAVCISLIFKDILTEMRPSNIKEIYKEKILRICSSFFIEFSDILMLSYYEDEIVNVLYES